jgi:serine/threonine-protein kinase HipA
LLDRFDINSNEGRNTRFHLITANALLKDTNTQCDRGGVFRYDDLVKLARFYSNRVEEDLIQLLTMMLFNRAINNTDTHERNFSYIHKDKGYSLAPAYDMVLSLSVGEYAVAGYEYSQQPPLASEAIKIGKIFGLSKTRVKLISEKIVAAIELWPNIAEKAGVCDKDINAIGKILRV